MKKVAAVLALSLMFCMPALAGTITFTPVDGNKAFSDPDFGPTSVSFVVGLLDDFGTAFDNGFSAIAADIGVNGGPTVRPSDPPNTVLGSSFVPAAGFTFDLQAIDPSSAFDSAIKLNFVNLFSPPYSLPRADIGVLTIDTLFAPEGTYDIMVLGGLGDPAGGSESVVGGASFQVNIPEPATLSLLALGALSMLRRRKKTA